MVSNQSPTYVDNTPAKGKSSNLHAVSAYLSSSAAPGAEQDALRIGSIKVPKSLLVCLSLVIILALSQNWFRSIALIYTAKTKQVVEFKREWVRNAGFLEDSGGKDTVFFMGNSKLTAGIIPREFDNRLNGRVYSYNLALPALPLAPHYFMLKDYLKRNKPPKYIVMSLIPGDFSHFLFPAYCILGADLKEVVWYSYLAENSEILWSYLYPLGSFWPSIKKCCLIQALSFLPAGLREEHKKAFLQGVVSQETYNHDWEYIYRSEYASPEKAATELQESLIKNRGYYYVIEQAVIGGRLPDDYIPPYIKNPPPQTTEVSVKALEKADPFVDKFFELNERNGTKVILIDDYFIDYKGRVNVPQGPHPDLWYQLQRKFKTVYFMKDRSDVKFYKPRFFSDPAHLNPEGAIIFTREMADGFSELLDSFYAKESGINHIKGQRGSNQPGSRQKD